MTNSIRRLAEHIHNELREVERSVHRAQTGWKRAQRSADDYYLDGVALNLHGFYGGLERIFERIAVTIDGARPTGEHWHRTLLDQMTQELPGIRPAVLSAGTRAALDEYRGFRHVVRNVYAFNFDPAKLERLVVDASRVFDRARMELIAFATFLEEQEA